MYTVWKARTGKKIRITYGDAADARARALLNGFDGIHIIQTFRGKNADKEASKYKLANDPKICGF